jgi:hypothetical protein
MEIKSLFLKKKKVDNLWQDYSGKIRKDKIIL